MEAKNNKYEVVLVLNPVLEEKDRTEVVEKISKAMKALDMQIDKENHLGLKNLVYKIAKFDKGDFWVFDISGKDPINLSDFNLLLNREVNIIRYLISKL